MSNRTRLVLLALAAGLISGHASAQDTMKVPSDYPYQVTIKKPKESVTSFYCVSVIIEKHERISIMADSYEKDDGVDNMKWTDVDLDECITGDTNSWTSTRDNFRKNYGPETKITVIAQRIQDEKKKILWPLSR